MLIAGKKDGKKKKSGGKRRTPKSKMDSWRGTERATDPGLGDHAKGRNIRGLVGGIKKIRKFYDLVFTVTMKSCFADLGVLARENGLILMMDKQVVQNKLWSNTEGKYQQHDSA
jgi:hypothetical protein